MSTWTATESQALTVTLVAEDGHRMGLTGEERHAAVHVMLDRGLDVETIAARLLLNLEALRRWANRHNVTLPPTVAPQAWWVGYVEPSSTASARRRRKATARGGQS